MGKKYNPYEDENPNDFNYQFDNPENQSNTSQYGTDFEKEVQTIWKLGIISIVTGILLMCCCGLGSLVTGIIGLNKASVLLPYAEQFSTETQNRLKSGRKMCIIGIVLGGVSLFIMFFGGFYQAFWEGFRSSFRQSSAVMLTGLL